MSVLVGQHGFTVESCTDVSMIGLKTKPSLSIEYPAAYRHIGRVLA